ATSDTSVILSFTEVGDGAAGSAWYVVRYAGSPINWSVASPASRGTCSSPMTGTAAGSRRSCSLNGLVAATAYGFQVRAYRAITGPDTVFGGISNIASTTTAAAAVVAASLIVSPGSVMTDVGQSSQFAATARDASGNALVGKTVTWTS